MFEAYPGWNRDCRPTKRLNLENSDRGPFTIRARGSPQGRGVRFAPGRALEPLRFVINSPANSCFDAASAGDPKENRARIFVEG